MKEIHPESDSVFPTRVGMNRNKNSMIVMQICIPHTRGDEPDGALDAAEATNVFLTRVGMNRTLSFLVVLAPEYSPHAWG